MTCERCGQVEDTKALEKYVARTGKVLCESCRAPKRNRLKYGDQVCVPHHGDFDLDENPVSDGLLFLPGVRHCGHSDCVNPDHIEGSPKPPERKRGRPAKPVDEDEAIVKRIRNRG